MDSIKKIIKINEELNNKLGNNEPFKIITRLLEEAGELAEQVNHFENVGVKVKKHGKPSKERLASEIQDVLRIALQIAMYYGIEEELNQSINTSYKKYYPQK